MLPLSLEVGPFTTYMQTCWTSASSRHMFGQHEIGLWVRPMVPAIS